MVNVLSEDVGARPDAPAFGSVRLALGGAVIQISIASRRGRRCSFALAPAHSGGGNAEKEKCGQLAGVRPGWVGSALDRVGLSAAACFVLNPPADAAGRRSRAGARSWP